MCRTRIKIIDVRIDYGVGDVEEVVNNFISNPENKVAKVNSVEIKNLNHIYNEGCITAIISYELGE